ncbi:MAG TPA: hypothetical protein VF530_12040, partial [Planctomycetota bacterium]
ARAEGAILTSMGSRRRFAISWRRMEPARRLRFLAWLIPIGVAHGLLSGSASLLAPDEHMRWAGLFAAMFMIPAAWITGWFLRGRIASARGTEAVALTLWSLLMGAWIAGSLLALLYGTVAIADGDLRRAASMIGLFWGYSISYCAMGVIFAFPTVLASIPVTWFAIRLLHRAAGGGVEARPVRELRAG